MNSGPANLEPDLHQRLAGLLLGTAVGDALGLPAEGLSRHRIERRWHGNWQHRFVLGHGMCSDDTEHTFFVAQALLAHPNDAVAFQRCLAWKLRLWLLGVPAGIGLATLRAILKLWLGFPPTRSGVFSAGNGPAMRSGIIGAYFFDDPIRRKEFVWAATRLTHTDPKAEVAALAVAEAAAWAVLGQEPLTELASRLSALGGGEEWAVICRKFEHGLAEGTSVFAFADALGLRNGVSGYAYHSVPIALYAWLRSPNNFQDALTSALNCGGDTDTVGAIVGALAGASVGTSGIPSEWLSGICEWPRSLSVLGQAAERLAEQKLGASALGPIKYFWPGLVPRNLAFLLIVLAHGFRRLAPPY
ncbi:MAG TPA: ADP-ribosylglycohydrolase family protein [Verrucomicrobiae bacterium]|nr:ADP-ribosylglycohydrolase family protein [Verrucomicrobiae bacterium]